MEIKDLGRYVYAVVAIDRFDCHYVVNTVSSEMEAIKIQSEFVESVGDLYKIDIVRVDIYDCLKTLGHVVEPIH